MYLLVFVSNNLDCHFRKQCDFLLDQYVKYPVMVEYCRTVIGHTAVTSSLYWSEGILQKFLIIVMMVMTIIIIIIFIIIILIQDLYSFTILRETIFIDL